MQDRTTTAVARLISRHWWGQSRRRRLVTVMVVASAVAAGWFVLGWDDWPAHSVIRTSEETWPLGFSHDGTTLITSGLEGISLWDTSSGQKRMTWPAPGTHRYQGVFAPDGRTFACAMLNVGATPVRIQLIDVAAGRVQSTLETHDPTEQHPTVVDLRFTPDGGRLRAILGDWNGVKELAFWDPATGQETERRMISCPVKAGHRAFSRDLQLMAVAGFGATTVTVWNLATDRQHLVLGESTSANRPPTAQAVSGLAFSSDGSTLAIGRGDGSLELWDLATALIRKTLQGHSPDHAPYFMQFTPDDAMLISQGDFIQTPSSIAVIRNRLERWWNRGVWRPNRELIVVDTASGQRLGHLKPINYAILSNDGRAMATHDVDSATRLRTMPVPRRSDGPGKPGP